MKSTFKIGNIDIQGVKLEDIEFTQEYTISEAMSLMDYGKKFVKELLKELPEMIEDIADIEETVDNGPMFKSMHSHSDMSGIRETDMPEHIKHFVKDVLGIDPEHVKVVRRG